MEAVVVDAGSKLVKAGFAAPDQPPSMIIPSQMKLVADDDTIGENALFEETTVDPIVRGIIKDWDAMEDLMHHIIYTGLGWEIGNEGQILFTDPLLSPKVVREQLVQMMFEKFNVSGFYASEQAVLSLYAVGRISGCTVDIGYEKIDIAPVIEGAVHHIASRKLDIGGADLTRLFSRELDKLNPMKNLSMGVVERLKEKYSCCAEDEAGYEKAFQSPDIEHHTLPDGQVTLKSMNYHPLISLLIPRDYEWLFQVIAVGKEKYMVGEALFKPSILGFEGNGIVDQLILSIATMASENHRQLLENTVLCGGTVSMSGFEERFQKEADRSSAPIRPSLVKPPEYMPEKMNEFSGWVGGAILAKVVFPQNQHLTKADYDENGPSIIHRKCF